MTKPRLLKTIPLACLVVLACDEPAVPNLFPTVTIQSPANGTAFEEGEVIRFRGSATDPEDGALPDSVLAWESDVDGIIGVGPEVTLVGGTPQLHTITFTAVDSEGDTGLATIEVTINPNLPPSASITAPGQGASRVERRAITFTADVSDPQQATLPDSSIVWTSDVVGELGRSATISVDSLGIGDHEIVLIATDALGLSDADTLDLTIVANQPPSVAIDSPMDGAAFEVGTPIAFSGTIVDLEDDSLAAGNVVWESLVDGHIGIGRDLVSDTLGIGIHTIRLTATDSHGDEASATATINVTAPAPTPGFRIELRFLTPATGPQMLAFTRAQARWGELITGDVADNPLTLPSGFCGQTAPAIESVIDDVLIFVVIDEFDGPGGVLGAAGPCALRNAGSIPIAGRMIFDVADVENLLASGRFDAVILHEMGHVLGIGTIWRTLGLLTGAGGADPFFTGASALAAFESVGGDDYDGDPVPVENMGGGGTRDSHWRESVFDNELMTGFLDSSPNPLSVVTVSSLEDLGYTVAVELSDPYVLPPPPGLQQPGLLLRDDVLEGPIVFVDRQGTIRRIER